MANVKSVERQIMNVEGFRIIIRDSDRRNVRSDKESLQDYDYERGMNGDYTVSEWRQKRFKYGTLAAEVLYGNGEVANGNTKLANVRDTYD